MKFILSARNDRFTKLIDRVRLFSIGFIRHVFGEKIGDFNGLFLKLIIIIVLFRFLYYSTMPSFITAGDSQTYIDYSFQDMLRLKFTNMRTPIYPLIIRLCSYISPINYLHMVALLQCLCSLISLILFWKIIRLFSDSKRICTVFMLLYGCNPQIFAWDKAILTESLAISGTVLFLYLIILYLHKPAQRYGVLISVLLFFLTLLRPSFMLFMFYYIIFLGTRFILITEQRKFIVLPFVASAFTIMLISIYSFLFEKQWGLFSITSVMPQQLLYVSIKEGFYSAGSNDAIVKDIHTLLSVGGDGETVSSVTQLWPIIDHYGIKTIQEFAINSFINCPKEYAKYIIDTIFTHGKGFFSMGYIFGEQRKFSSIVGRIYSNSMILTGSVFSIVRLSHAYVFTISEFILWIRHRKNHVLSWIHFGLWVFMLSIILSTFILTNAAFDRTMVHIIPFVYVSILLLFI